MNDVTGLADFVWQQGAWIFGSLVALFIVTCHLLGRLGVERWAAPCLRGDALFLLLLQLFFVPFFGFLIAYCYLYPEKIGGDPDPLVNWSNDLRNVWPLAALLEAFVLAWFLRIVWVTRWERRAGRLIRRATQLQAEGRLEEADDAYLAWRRVYETKCGGRLGPLPPDLRHRA